MKLQTTRQRFSRYSPPLPPGKKDYLYEIQPKLQIAAKTNVELKDATEKNPEINLPIIATSNDLREVVKFLRRRPNGVSIVETMNAEPRRVFDARKIAAYEFWGIISINNERIQLSALGNELAKTTEDETAIHRKILRSIPAYYSALDWIYQQKLNIATYLDVAKFWRISSRDLNLSGRNEENIEAVIVSFFSLCHAAELGTATVGKRGQPARMSVSLEQLALFLESPPGEDESMATPIPPSIHTPISSRPNIYPLPVMRSGDIGRIYISPGAGRQSIEKLSAALELADFESLSFETKAFKNGFLPDAGLSAMKQCQAAIFLISEKDCSMQKAKLLLHCDRITEISIARALFDERVVLLWNGGEIPESLKDSGFNCIEGDPLNWEVNVKLVKSLKGFAA